MREDYVQWSRLSGLYLDHVSQGDCYRTYAKQLSAPGLVAIVVHEFLEDNPHKIDVGNWRSYAVPEMAGDLRFRIETTANALKAIGAPRLATAVLHAKSHSPFDALLKGGFGGKGLIDSVQSLVQGFQKAISPATSPQAPAGDQPQQANTAQEAAIKQSAAEAAALLHGKYETHAEVSRLLDLYLVQHAEQLQADIARHGDPRKLPGFTLAQRRQELDQLRQKKHLQEKQRDDLRSMTELLQRLEKLISADTVDKNTQKKQASKIQRVRKDLLRKFKANQKLPPEVLIPEMAELLPKISALLTQHPQVAQPDHVGDPALNARLAAIGEYESEIFKVDKRLKLLELRWDSPAALQQAWIPFSLMMMVPLNQPQALAAALDIYERLVSRFARHVEQCQQQLVSSFHEIYQGQLDEEELLAYEFDAHEDATAASILTQVKRATVTISVEDDRGDAISTVTHFAVPWDEEHGFEFYWDDAEEQELAEIAAEGASDSATSSNLTALLTQQQFHLKDPGPKLAAADLLQFETEFGRTLPEEYRQLLLAFNGGVPEPAHLVVSVNGLQRHVDVERFFSLLGTLGPTEKQPTGSQQGLEQQNLEQQLREGGFPWPDDLLPIANAGFTGTPGSVLLVLVLSGKKAGQIVLIEQDALKLAPDDSPHERQVRLAEFQYTAQYAPLVAGNLSSLFSKKLQPVPRLEYPVWLQAIRQHDVAGFLAWLAVGGSLKEEFTDLTWPLPLTVTEYLAKEAGVELLEPLLEQQQLRPRDLKQGWERYSLDPARFETLLPLLPKSLWTSVLAYPQVWNHPSLLTLLAKSGVDFNAAINSEGSTPIHLAVQHGSKAGVKWLMQQGADPRKADRYGRDAFIWAEGGPGYDCLPLLAGRDELETPVGAAEPDVPGIAELQQAASKLPDGVSLMIKFEIKSPPVTRVEKLYYPQGLHYLLAIDVVRHQVTFKDMTSPRQDYLYAAGYPDILYAPILQWPDLSPDWETLAVEELDWSLAGRRPKYQPLSRPELVEAARSALQQALNPQAAAARKVRLRK